MSGIIMLLLGVVIGAVSVVILRRLAAPPTPTEDERSALLLGIREAWKLLYKEGFRKGYKLGLRRSRHASIHGEARN